MRRIRCSVLTDAQLFERVEVPSHAFVSGALLILQL
jgi:hypothetical protein